MNHDKVQHNLRELVTGNRERLTHWGRDKMAAIFQTIFSNTLSLMKISIKISLNFVPKGPYDGKFIDAYMRHLASMR